MLAKGVLINKIKLNVILTTSISLAIASALLLVAGRLLPKAVNYNNVWMERLNFSGLMYYYYLPVQSHSQLPIPDTEQLYFVDEAAQCTLMSTVINNKNIAL